MIKISETNLAKYKDHIKYGDLFTNTGKAYLAQCISADIRLGAGIAVEFDRRFDMRFNIMFDRKMSEDNFMPGINYPVYLVKDTFNIVTKKFYYNKPTYESFKRGLGAMRTMISWHKENGLLKYNKVCMPMLGCGLDKLDPNNVIPIIDLYLGDLIDWEIWLLPEKNNKKS